MEDHGWTFVSESRIVHDGPLRLVRVIFHANNKGDSIKAYDGLSAQGRQVCDIRNYDDTTHTHEFGIRLTTGLYVTISASTHATIVFDPLDKA